MSLAFSICQILSAIQFNLEHCEECATAAAMPGPGRVPAKVKVQAEALTKKEAEFRLGLASSETPRRSPCQVLF